MNSEVVTREDLKNVFEALGEGSYGTRIDALETKVSVIGNTVSGNSSATLANTSSLTKLADITTLDAGSWIIAVTVDFSVASATGRRSYQLNVNGENYAVTYNTFAGENARQAHSITLPVKSSVSLDVDLYAQQNSGSSMTVYYYWRAMRIA